MGSWYLALFVGSGSGGRAGGLQPPLPHFFRITNNFLLFESVAFNFAVWVTNFVAASCRLRKTNLTADSRFILQTTPDISAGHVQTVCLGCSMSYFILLVLRILFINIAGTVFISNNASNKNNRILSTASTMQSGSQNGNATAADQREVGGGGKD